VIIATRPEKYRNIRSRRAAPPPRRNKTVAPPSFDVGAPPPANFNRRAAAGQEMRRRGLDPFDDVAGEKRLWASKVIWKIDLSTCQSNFWLRLLRRIAPKHQRQ